MNLDEALDVTKIYSISGKLPHKTPIINTRPFRSPHHSISNTSLIGGGRYPMPGEISLAHNGVLFLDELPEFSKESLEALRQPLEEGSVTVSRLSGSIDFPAAIILICSANPCKCGHFLNPYKECTCTSSQIQKYLGKLSGPLLDRIDLHLEVLPVSFNDLNKISDGETSETIRNRVNRTRKIQKNRYDKIKISTNSQLSSSNINKFCKLDNECKDILKMVFEKLGLSARARDSILKVSRTIADMEAAEEIKSEHISEAVQYRNFDRKLWF